MLIMLDPGHGGEDPGAVGSGLQEKDVVLALSKLIRNYLTSFQVEVILTREDDLTVPLLKRAELANSHNADFFCSLHINSGGGTGFESYIYTHAGETTKKLRAIIHQELSRFLNSFGFVDRGAKQANYAVLRETKMPAVLLETLFIDNPKDSASLADPIFLNKMAAAIASGFKKALNLQEKPGWDPAREISRLKERGLITEAHPPESFVTWGEFATVMNRLLDRLE